MGDAPRDGRVIVLTSADGQETEAYWRKTTRHENHRWVPHAFWADPMSNMPVKFEPEAWRPRFS